MPAPRKGEIIDGYEFLGGDPNDERSWASWGPGARALPNGAIVRDGPRGGVTELRAASGGEGSQPLREFEINAAGRATLMDEGQREYTRARRDGYDPGSLKNLIAGAAEPIWGVGPYIADVIRDDPSERGRAAELQFVDGALRTTSGANAPEPEVRRASRAYFRQPGESASVEPNKARIRERFRNTAIKAAGAAYIGREGDTPPGASAPARPKTPPVPAAARAAAARIRTSTTAAFGTRENPYVARSQDVLDKLSNDPRHRGKYVIAPDGSFGVIE